MLKQISIIINNKHFNLSVDDDFAVFLRETAPQDLNLDGNNNIEKILRGYIRAKYELYLQKEKITKILDNFD